MLKETALQKLFNGVTAVFLYPDEGSGYIKMGFFSKKETVEKHNRNTRRNAI